MGSDVFEQNAQGAFEVHDHFKRNLPHDSLLPWEPKNWSGNLSMMFSNRYFASVEEAEGQRPLELGEEVDPDGMLRQAVPRGVHTMDNQVAYYERVLTSDGK